MANIQGMIDFTLMQSIVCLLSFAGKQHRSVDTTPDANNGKYTFAPVRELLFFFCFISQRSIQLAHYLIVALETEYAKKEASGSSSAKHHDERNLLDQIYYHEIMEAQF